MVKIIESEESFASTGNVYLSINNSRQMFSRTIVKLGGKVLAYQSTVHLLPLGNISRIAGHALVVKTDITDTNPELDQTISIITLTTDTHEESYSRTSPTEDGDVVIFATTIDISEA